MRHHSCNSEALAAAVTQALPSVYVVCFTTLCEDRAVSLFTKAFYRSMAALIAMDTPGSHACPRYIPYRLHCC